MIWELFGIPLMEKINIAEYQYVESERLFARKR